MTRKLSAITTVTPAVIASAELTVETAGEGFLDITAEARKFLQGAQARDGTLLLFLRHTSASLTIQENADPDVLRDLTSALQHLAPRDFGWVHDTEGPDDMPAHVRTMLTGISLQIPVLGGQMTLGTWQGIYLIEHRARPHRRQIVLQFIGRAA
jgi:secondary thiamine-phosphate synthase enzyme